ncbi:helix-turn-helix domain-containing protein [Streptomyces sp. NPDC052236]|uniref:MmyB family transcriptional regulator n=1 Tax=Streptomyces sp. NPDC052236 TaxID=3365686 RepID=UPI0037CDEC37
MTHEAGAERPGVQARRGRAGMARGAVRTRRVTDVLRSRREELGLSEEDVAARLKISTVAYGSWERTPAQDWTDDTLCALVEALEMSDQQGGWLFRLAVDRDPPPPWKTPPVPALPLGPARPSGPAFPSVPLRPFLPVPPSVPVSQGSQSSADSMGESETSDSAVPSDAADPETVAYLRDYAALMDAVPLPSALFDRRWNVAHVNPAFQELFHGIGPHPTAMPDQNFLRFVLFHPDAEMVLADREASWCLPFLAQLESALESYEDDPTLQSIRRDIAEDPIMDAAFRCGLSHWMRVAGAAAVHHDGAVRPLNHPDPRWGRTDCRIVDETPASLQDRGYTRMTLVLRDARAADPARRRGKTHLRAVSSG